MFKSLVILNRLIDSPTIEECKKIENQNAFLELFKCQELACFLYSLFANAEQFQQAFGNADLNYFKEAHTREWATQIRYDTIRNQLAGALNKNPDINYLFLDFCLRNRKLNSNKFLFKEFFIKLLVPEKSEFELAKKIIEELGFRRINIASGIKGKIARKFDKNPNSVFYKRNEFMVVLSLRLPTIMSEFLNYDDIIQRKTEINFDDKKYCVLSENDELVYSLLNLNDTVLLDKYFLTELIIANLFLKRQLELPKLSSNLKKLTETMINFVNDIFEIKKFPNQEYSKLIKNPSRVKKLLIWKPEMKIVNLVKILVEIKNH